MAKKKEEIQEIVEEEDNAIFLRKVDVVICNGEEEPVVIKAEE